MPEPRVLSYDPTTQMATVADINGSPVQVHRSGLVGDLASLGQEADAYGSNMSDPGNAFNALAPGQAEAEQARRAADQRFDAMPASGVVAGGGGAYVPDAGSVGTGVPASRTIQERPPAPATDPQLSTLTTETPGAAQQTSPDASGYVFRQQGNGMDNPYLNGQQPRFARLPGHTQTQTATQTTQRLPLTGPAAAMAQRADDASMQQQNAAIGMSAGQQEANERTAEAANVSADLMERAASQRAQRIDAREAERQRLMGEADELLNASRAEINPQRILGGAGNQILAAISVAFGAAGSALTGGPNAAMQIIDTAIANDIAAQRENRLSKAEAAKGKLSALELASRISDDELTQRDIATASMLGATEQVLKSHIARIGAQNAPEELTALLGQLEQQNVELQTRIAASLGDQAVINSTSRQLGGGLVDMSKLYDRQVLGVEDRDPARFVPRAGGNAPSDIEARELRKFGTDMGNMQSVVDQLIALREKTATRVPGTEENAVAQQLSNRLALLLKSDSFGQLGVLAGPDMDILKSISGNPGAVFSREGARLSNLRGLLQEEEASAYRDRGVAPVRDIPEAFRQRQRVDQAAVTGQGSGRRGATDFQRIE